MFAGDHFCINVPKVSHETIDGETLIINLENGNYYSLVGTGAGIWSLLASGAAVDDIVKVIDHQYSGARVGIERAIGKFVAELQEEGLIVQDQGYASERVVRMDARIETKAGEGRPAFEVPVLNKYTDMQDLLLLDPIHEVDEKTGWPIPRPPAVE